MRRLSASLEVFWADEVTLVGLGHTAMRADPVPPAPRSLARKDESIVVGDAVVVRALVIDRQCLAIRRDDPMHGANDLPSLRERKVPCPGINRLWRHAVGVWVAGNRIALAVGLVGHVHRCFLAVGTDGFAVKR